MEENKMLQDIKNLKPVQAFLKEHNLDESFIENNALVFCSYKIKLDKCRGCKGIEYCSQPFSGNAPSLIYNGHNLLVEFLPCKYQQKIKLEQDKKSRLTTIGTNFASFDFSDVYNNNERKELLIKVKDIYNAYKNNQSNKGLYIYGPYGCGKSYVLAWLAEKLVELNATVLFAYYPELVRNVKSSISEGMLEEYLEELKNTDVLMIDDIGGESNTDFIRDEVLGAVLQYRMSNNLLTFMSSNLDPKLLLEHLSSGSKDVDRVKGSRVFERIKTLMDFVLLKDKNYRN